MWKPTQLVNNISKIFLIIIEGKCWTYSGHINFFIFYMGGQKVSFN